MKNIKYPMKLEHWIPIYGIVKYLNGMPLTNEKENTKIMKNLGVLTIYNVIFSTITAVGVKESLENLLK